ncbi:MAG: 6-pyruvoyl-tetrahydropterin synthase-related protein [Polyangiaceae bacterium]|nr:6-pyruvoyl-tetrahydropterin synthase-related protein [Polyangiaceae bacterium]
MNRVGCVSWLGKNRDAASCREATLYVFCCVAALSVVAPYAADGGWPQTTEMNRYPLLVEHFYQAFLSGKWWPRWLPNLDGGYGYAEFVFYQPLFFFLAIPFRAIFGGPVAATWGAIAATLALGACGSFRLCHGGREPRLGICGATLFLFAPYVYVNWLARGDLSELLATALCPWVLAFYIEALTENAKGGSHRLGYSLALSLLAHPVVGVSLGMFLALGSLSLLPRARDRRILRVLTVEGVRAVCVSTPYWLPVILMAHTTHIDGAFNWDPVPNTVPPWLLLGHQWSPSAAKNNFSLGPISLALALAGAAVAWRYRQTRILGGILIAALVLMTPWLAAAWRIPPLSTFQFPWRFLSLCVALQIGLMRGLGEVRSDLRSFAGSICLPVILVAGWVPGQFKVEARLADAEVSLRYVFSTSLTRRETLDVLGEKRPRTVTDLPKLPIGLAGERLAAPPGVSVQALPGNDAHWLRYAISAAKPSEITIRQFFLPGWLIEVDGEKVSDETLRERLQPDGLIRLLVAPRPDGRPVKLTATYADPRGANVGYWLAALTLLTPWAIRRLRKLRHIPRAQKFLRQKRDQPEHQSDGHLDHV